MSDASRPVRRRTPGLVRDRLIAAGVDQARAGGPGAVVLREATRAVGVSPNAAYRHFANRDDLVAAVAQEATAMLAARMQTGIDAVTARPGSKTRARARLRAVGLAYLAFAREERGLFTTAFSAPVGPHQTPRADGGGDNPRSPLRILDDTLDELVAAGVLPRARRPRATAMAWATVHGLATLRLSGDLDGGLSDELDDAVDRFIQRGL